MTLAELHRQIAQCNRQIAQSVTRLSELHQAIAAQHDTPTATPRKARRVAPPEPATARGIAIARQEIDRHRRSKGT